MNIDWIEVIIPNGEVLGRVIGNQGRNIALLKKLSDENGVKLELPIASRPIHLLVQAQQENTDEIIRILKLLIATEGIYPTRIENLFKNSFPKQVCPDCGGPISNDWIDGNSPNHGTIECSNQIIGTNGLSRYCGHIFYENKQDHEKHYGKTK